MEPENAPTRGSYAPRQPVTLDDELRVDAALEKTKGHRPFAATMLGITEERLNNIVIHRPHLKEKWGFHKREVPEGAAAEIERKEPVKPYSDEDLKVAEAIKRQDTMLQSGWGKLGYTDNQRDFLLQLQVSYASNIRGTLDLTYGGMMHAFVRLLFVFEDLVKRIEDIDANPDKYVRIAYTESGTNEIKSPHEFRCELYDRLISISGELRKVNNDATKANWVRAQLERLKSDEGKDARRKKPGWGARKVNGPAAKEVDAQAAEDIIA